MLSLVVLISPTEGKTMNNNTTATAVALPRLTPAQAGAQAAWADDQANPLERMIGKVTHGDCLQVLRQLPDACTDMVLTDPPYLVRYRDRSGRRIENDDNTRWMFPAFSEIYRVLKPNSYAVSFYGWGKVDRFLSVWRECGFHPVGHFVWVKRYASCVRRTQMMHEQAYLLAKGNPLPPASPPADVLPWSYTGNRLHPTQKPVASLTPLIEAFSRPSDLILDPFGGSGSTGAAARVCNRRFLLIEKDAAYCRAAQERLR
jgi:adenine-specific DNA-methyltransferase